MTKNYKELFEDLMEYTDFKSSNEITSRSDLFDFFKQVKKDSSKKGRKFIVSKKLFKSIAEAVIDVVKSGKPVERKIKRLVESRNVFTSFSAASAHDATAVYNGKRIYKSIVIVYRDRNGKIIRDKKLKKLLKEMHTRKVRRFRVWEK